jgi:hypothetical protein
MRRIPFDSVSGFKKAVSVRQNVDIPLTRGNNLNFFTTPLVRGDSMSQRLGFYKQILFLK